ncbi:MAG: hypothetical protein OXN83_05245 [Oligoflexia bacterium]|nr:hypothetical protein [Oligoflexia bacterium]
MNPSITPAVKEIWSLIEETQKNLKELSISQKETDQQIKKFSSELSATQKETAEQMKKTDIKLNKYIGDTGNYWGKLGENLVKGNLAQRLKERGIKVEGVITNAKKGGAEFDIIAVNGREVVVVEVKATLDPSDVYEFKEDIEKFKTIWPDFKEKTVYGAMASLMKSNKQAENLAEKYGFFVISATGDVIIQNKENFKPKVFN